MQLGTWQRSFLFTGLAFWVLTLGVSQAEEGSEGVFRHVVLLKFTETATEEQIVEIETEFAKLPDEIDTITGFEWGRTKTVEVDLAKGYTHCFLVTFADQAGLEAYLPHPAHKAFVAKLRPILEEVHVFDYVPGE
ncbi:MAG: Dabb family protein [Verrucomicrobiota bacterium]